MSEDTKTLVFAATICITCSLLLSGAAAGLKGLQEANKEFDQHRNIVKAFGIDTSTISRPEIEQTFEDHVNKVSTESGNETLPVYTWTETGDDKPSKYAFPISGKGLWSTLYGYIALESDLETIAGLTFYKHGETPGLGAEIEKSWFQDNFKGKKLYADGVATEFMIVKGKAPKDNDHAVDGISGATLTGKGVQALLRKDAAAYAEFFNQIEGN